MVRKSLSELGRGSQNPRMEKSLEDREAAYRESPNDFESAFTLGVSYLERILDRETWHHAASDPSEIKAVSTVLLKAAKLGISKADPFALLGWWYEHLGDKKRSLGCYSKALMLNPTNPVAGRGMVRLCAFADIKATCKKAAETISTENGWAWLALGRTSAIEIGKDDTAAYFFQHALRCQDVENPEVNPLHKFYIGPKSQGESSSQIRKHLVWIDLADCYRRQGKLNAAVSAYKHASIAHDSQLPSSALCSWGQIELILGLTMEADGRFQEVLFSEPHNPVAAFGHASCLLERAKVSATQGKNGLALENLKDASHTLQSILISPDQSAIRATQTNSVSEYLCVLKLLGDLYTFGYHLPSDVFVASDDQIVHGKLEFVSQGEEAYRQVLTSAIALSKDATFLSAASFDVGTNLLSQAWILCSSMGEGIGGNTPTSFFDLARQEAVAKRLSKAVESFVFAIECNPLVSPAWCGLGCAWIASEPLKAQHCFCQALQLDMKDTNSYTNIGMLCTNFSSLDAAAEAFDCLTQIADSPMTWIGRGLAHEIRARNALSVVDQNIHFMNASDAYRASLQVNQNVGALLGLSLTARRTGMRSSSVIGQEKSYITALERATSEESTSSLSIFLSSTSEANIAAVLLGGMLNVEGSFWRKDTGRKQLLQKGSDLINSVKSSVHAWTALKNDTVLENKIRPVDTTAGGASLIDLFNASTTAVNSIYSIEQNRNRDKRNMTKSLEYTRNQVHAYPDDGIAWLEYGKQLVFETARLKKNDEDKSDVYLRTLDSARIALFKSSSLLHDCLTDAKLILAKRHASDADVNKEIFGDENVSSMATLKAVVPDVVNAEIYAESIALHAVCVCTLRLLQNVDPEEPSACKSRKFSLAEMQKALLVDPENAIARKGLGLKHG